MIDWRCVELQGHWWEISTHWQDKSKLYERHISSSESALHPHKGRFAVTHFPTSHKHAECISFAKPSFQTYFESHITLALVGLHQLLISGIAWNKQQTWIASHTHCNQTSKNTAPSGQTLCRVPLTRSQLDVVLWSPSGPASETLVLRLGRFVSTE